MSLSYNSAIDFYVKEIAKNCKNKRKKNVAIKHLTKVMESLKIEDKLRIQLWEIIQVLEKIEPGRNNDEDEYYN